VVLCFACADDASHPDYVRNGALSGGERGPDRWFDTAAFVRQAPNTFGNAGNGVLRDPGISNVDFAIQKKIPVGESKRFEFRAEAFNVSNTPPLNDPNGSFGSAAFGSITSAGNPRVFEFVGKVRF